MYDPTIPPVVEEDGAKAAVAYVYAELQSIAGALQGITQGQYIQVLHAAPTKPREPQIVFADGSDWNPGSGKGLYVYYGSAWHFAG